MNVFVPFPLSLSGHTGQRLDAELLGKLRRLLCPKAGGLLFLSSAHHRIIGSPTVQKSILLAAIQKGIPRHDSRILWTSRRQSHENDLRRRLGNRRIAFLSDRTFPPSLSL
jgi:hypothetical protein